MLLLIFIIVLALMLLGWGAYPHYGYLGWSPLGAILLILLVLWLAGVLHA